MVRRWRRGEAAGGEALGEEEEDAVEILDGEAVGSMAAAARLARWSAGRWRWLTYGDEVRLRRGRRSAGDGARTGSACGHGAETDEVVRPARVAATSVSMGNCGGAGGEFERQVGGGGARGRAAPGRQEGTAAVRVGAVGRNEPVVRDTMGRQ